MSTEKIQLELIQIMDFAQLWAQTPSYETPGTPGITHVASYTIAIRAFIIYRILILDISVTPFKCDLRVMKTNLRVKFDTTYTQRKVHRTQENLRCHTHLLSFLKITRESRVHFSVLHDKHSARLRKSWFCTTAFQ